MAHLLSPISIKGLSLKNRIVMPPMASESATERGMATERTFEYYEERAVGGVGLIIVEHTYILSSGRRSVKQLGIHTDEHVVPLRELAERIKRHGAGAGIQITHAGAAAVSSVIGAPPIAPSEVALSPDRETPSAIGRDEIPRLIQGFADAAVRAKSAGFDMIELHGAHGYLLNQFLSPFTNRRKDEYGGDLDGRLRFPLEVTAAVRKAVGPDTVLFYRLGADDGVAGGLTVHDACRVAPRLVETGIDAIDVSGGLSGSGRDGSRGEGYFVHLSEAIKRAVTVPVVVTGGITSPAFADSVVARNAADLVGIGRALLANPRWALDAYDVLGGNS